MCRRLIVLLAAIAVHAPMRASAAEPQQAESPSVAVRTSIKATGLVSRYPDAPDVFAERTASESLLRVRVEPVIRPNDHTLFTFAYEQRLRYASLPSPGLMAAGALPSEWTAPFRIEPLVWRLSESASATWRHEIDRANVQLDTGRGHLTIGRQAIGWGRGVMFTAVDLFAPFSPLEADREWRPGVDAIRADIKITDRSSLDLVAAFGRTVDRSVFAARARGFAGEIDVELVGGRRGQDLFGGVTSSAAAGPAEVHGEVAAFRVPSGADHDIVWKIVAGGSYRVPIGTGILAFAEYHYSGFGARRPADIRALAATPSFLERFARGDTQILSRHVIGVMASYEMSPEASYSTQWLLNPADRSGIVTPALTYTFNDAVSLFGAAYLPYGRPPQGPQLRSEFGATPLSGLVQLRMYF